MNKKLTEGLKEWQRKVDAGEIERPKAKNPREKALDNPTSLRKAVNAKCWDCCCEVRIEVTKCSATDCPLWKLRPWQK